LFFRRVLPGAQELERANSRSGSAPTRSRHSARCWRRRCCLFCGSAGCCSRTPRPSPPPRCCSLGSPAGPGSAGSAPGHQFGPTQVPDCATCGPRNTNLAITVEGRERITRHWQQLERLRELAAAPSA